MKRDYADNLQYDMQWGGYIDLRPCRKNGEHALQLLYLPWKMNTKITERDGRSNAMTSVRTHSLRCRTQGEHVRLRAEAAQQAGQRVRQDSEAAGRRPRPRLRRRRLRRVPPAVAAESRPLLRQVREPAELPSFPPAQVTRCWGFVLQL